VAVVVDVVLAIRSHRPLVSCWPAGQV
jgi:hypothetical protein